MLIAFVKCYRNREEILHVKFKELLVGQSVETIYIAMQGYFCTGSNLMAVKYKDSDFWLREDSIRPLPYVPK